MDNTDHAMAPSSSSRSSVLLDQIHQEFQNQSRASAEYEYKCTSFFSTFKIAPPPTPFPFFIAWNPTPPLNQWEEHCFPSQISFPLIFFSLLLFNCSTRFHTKLDPTGLKHGIISLHSPVFCNAVFSTERQFSLS